MQQEMNIIFLDIDGVISTFRFIDYQEKHCECNYYDADKNFDPICMNNLKTLIEETNSYIVLSSSWRKSKELVDYIIGNLRQYKINNRLFSSTGTKNTREEEILEWLDNFRDIKINYVILDDDVIKLNNFVKCDSYNGFTKECLRQALNIFEGVNE